MDEELKTFLVGMETRLTAQARDVETRLEGRITEQIKASEERVAEQIKASEAALEERVVEQIKASEAALEERVAERISDSETKLLRAFWEWGRTTDQKLRRLDTNDSTTLARVSILEERVFALERKSAGSPE